jgi:hypothetical protein
MRIALCAMLLTGCATFAKASKVAAATAIGIDWAQTISASDGGRWTSYRETNPIMGERPSVLAIQSYMSGCMAGTFAIGERLPERWQPVWYLSIAAFESYVAATNVDDMSH